MNKRIVALAAVILTFGVFATAWTACAQEDGVVGHEISPEEMKASEGYWTPERMRNARPMEMNRVDEGSYRTACTEEAMICPDGSAVGREGPNCEFSPCPGGGGAGQGGYGNPDAVACTKEAKMCPDGSAVGREGPDCEFAPCPQSGEASPPSYEVMPDEMPAQE
jgi:hypothetical protein